MRRWRRVQGHVLIAKLSIRAIRVAQIRMARMPTNRMRPVCYAPCMISPTWPFPCRLLHAQGFIDDVEFAVDKAGAVQVRSASRVGKLDFFVNSKRLNWISEKLRQKGWNAPAISQKTHPEYFRQNGQR